MTVFTRYARCRGSPTSWFRPKACAIRFANCAPSPNVPLMRLQRGSVARLACGASLYSPPRSLFHLRRFSHGFDCPSRFAQTQNPTGGLARHPKIDAFFRCRSSTRVRTVLNSRSTFSLAPGSRFVPRICSINFSISAELVRGVSSLLAIVGRSPLHLEWQILPPTITTTYVRLGGFFSNAHFFNQMRLLTEEVNKLVEERCQASMLTLNLPDDE